MVELLWTLTQLPLNSSHNHAVIKTKVSLDVHGDPVVKTPHFQYRE